MNKLNKKNHYDVIIVGSGTCGATIARELCKQHKKVLVLEKGSNKRLSETLLGMAPILNEVSVAPNMKDMRAITAGGTSAVYFAVAATPPFDTFKSLGIDLEDVYEEASKELPLDYLPDELFGPQTLRLRDSAKELGHDWEKQPMLVDQSKCKSGYSYEAKWKAKSYLEDAIKDGAEVRYKADVTRILFDNNKAIGVEYKSSKKSSKPADQVFGDKIILSAGVLATPKILKDNGVNNVGNKGFYFDPNQVLFGLIPGLKSKGNFIGAMETYIEDDISLGDANVPGIFYRLLMLSLFKPKHLFSYSNSIGIGVKVHEPMGGEVKENGEYHKELSKEVFEKLEKGEKEAIRILKNAGARDIVKSPVNVTSTGGLLQINEHVDSNLQTQFENLFVCDRSILPHTFRKPPTLTLVCLGKYLAKHLSSLN
ncbi:GMC family oxidoreductase N-terminal domain-containing protein [Flavobacteriaceae bacterium M23B6Z8]